MEHPQYKPFQLRRRIAFEWHRLLKKQQIIPRSSSWLRHGMPCLAAAIIMQKSQGTFHIHSASVLAHYVHFV